MNNTASTPGVTVHYDFAEWYKPEGRGRHFDGLRRGLARRLRTYVVRITKWEQAHPFHDARPPAEYGHPWTSDHCLANFSFACECHRNVRYKRHGRPRTFREGRYQ